MKKGGILEVIIGTMYSGKSTELIRRVLRHKHSYDCAVQLFKPSIDKRYDDQAVASHDGFKLSATPISDTNELLAALNQETKIIGIDEIQFFEEEIINYCVKWTRKENKIVVVAGLTKDFRDLPFPFRNSTKTIYSHLLPHADKPWPLDAICMYKDGKNGKCDNEATRVQRFIDETIAPFDAPLIVVGGKESYKVFCNEHYTFYEQAAYIL